MKKITLNRQRIFFYWPIIFVVACQAIPAFFRVDVWPMSTIGMYSEAADINSIWSYQLFLKNERGLERPIPISCEKLCIYLIGNNLGNRPDIVERLLPAVTHPLQGPLVPFSGYYVLKKSRKIEGVNSKRDLHTENVFETRWLP